MIKVVQNLSSYVGSIWLTRPLIIHNTVHWSLRHTKSFICPDDFDHCVIKRTIHGLYSRKIAPTVSIIHKEIKDSIEISKSKLTLTLIDLGTKRGIVYLWGPLDVCSWLVYFGDGMLSPWHNSISVHFS
jgi:hypothetical protein